MPLAPWLVWVPALAVVNLLLFVAIRGRWGRSFPLLAIASVAGVIVGNELARTVGIEVLRIGDMNVLGACVVAQLFMIGLSLLAALGPIRVEE
ncbi:MAG TPA: hypothetical protein VF367_06825 [Candidatus Limnocylindria bacterium]|jgi:hypothetical protein